jgi:hypothetical protein
MTLLAAYSFGGTGSTITDDSGNGRDFTLDASTVRAAGGGLTRTAIGTTIGPSLAGLQTPLRSISCRVSRTSLGDGWFPTFSASGTGVWGLIDLGGQRQARARNASGFAAAQQAAATGEQALAATYDGTNVRLYVAGVLVATSPLAGPLRTDATQFQILATTGPETVLKDLRIYDHVLTLAEVQADRDTPVTAAVAASGALDLSGTGTLTLSGSPALSAPLGLSGTGTLTRSETPSLAAPLLLDGAGDLDLAPSGMAVSSSLALSGAGALSVRQLGAVRDLTLAGSLEPARFRAVVERARLSGVVEQ